MNPDLLEEAVDSKCLQYWPLWTPTALKLSLQQLPVVRAQERYAVYCPMR